MKDWIKLDRKGGLLIEDVFNLTQYIPFFLLDWNEEIEQEFIYYVDEDNFGEWSSDIDTKPRYTHILPNVPRLKQR